MYAKFLKIVLGHFCVFLTQKMCQCTLFITSLTEVEERNLLALDKMHQVALARYPN